MKQIRRHLTYANVMSSIAVFLMLGGATAFAAKKIGANELKGNSVKTGKIVKEAVTASKLKKGAVTETKIADGAVTTNKIGNDAVTGAKANESTFGQVPNAKTLDGIGSSAFSREASSAIDNNAITPGSTGNQTAREVSITAPQAGFLLIIASSDVFGSATDFVDCEINVDGTNLSVSRRSIEITSPSNLEENCGTNTIVPATAGKHTVKFNYIGLGATTTVDETELDVVFVPFAG